MRPSSTSRATLSMLRVALQETLVVQPLAHRVDPAEAQHDVDGFLGRDRFQPRPHLVHLDPDFGFRGMVLAQPGVETGRVREFPNLVRIDLDRRHQSACPF
jgi:hypothetical protein